MRRPALIFDFGNVVAHFDYRKAASTLGDRLGLSGEELLERLRPLGFSDLVRSYESGRITAEAFSKGRSGLALGTAIVFLSGAAFAGAVWLYGIEGLEGIKTVGGKGLARERSRARD